MPKHHWTVAPLVFAWLAEAGCTTLREIPRSEYAARPERQHVRVTTHEGLVYDFDYARVASDTLVGSRERESEGPVRDIATLAIPLADIDRFSSHGVDWYRTGIIGGGVLAGVIVAGLSAVHNNNGKGDGTAGGPKGVPGGD